MNQIFHALFQQQRLFINRLNEVLKVHDLYSSQWTVLFCLHQNGPMTLTQIWRYLHVEAPTVTRTVARLETLGWVERLIGDDKREKIVCLTDMAQRRFPAIVQTIEAYEREMIGDLTIAEQQQLMYLLQKMKGSE